MTVSISANDVQGLEYVVLGVATCFQRNEEGRLEEVMVAEPIPAAELDCLHSTNRSTSYQLLYATTFAEIVQGGAPSLPQDVIPDRTLPCKDFVERAKAATRSYRAKPDFKHLAIGAVTTTSSPDFPLNYSSEPKRVLDVIYNPSDDDNVKQHAYTHLKL
ncbi:MAG: hypothetical protein AB4040_00665 [Synechococcus sp.]